MSHRCAGGGARGRCGLGDHDDPARQRDRDGSGGELRCHRPGISSDGRYIAYVSSSSNLVPNDGDTNGGDDVFILDRQARQVTRVSVKPNGDQAEASDPASFGQLRPAITADGRFVAFATLLELVPNDTNQQVDIYVHDRDADEDGTFDEPGGIETVRVNVANGWHASGPVQLVLPRHQ